MKTYSHDYTKVADADCLLHCAIRSLAGEKYDIAQDCIAEARGLLQEYLSQDNMVEDDDCCPAWVKLSDIEGILIDD